MSIESTPDERRVFIIGMLQTKGATFDHGVV